MTTKQLSLHCKTWGMLCLAGGVLTMVSCVQDDLKGGTFDCGVYNTQLEAPSADEITVTPSSDGASQVFKWPVVEGAGGYHAVLTNADNGEVVKDTLVDNITFSTIREEDTNYQLALSVLDNKERNNKGTEPVSKLFNTFTPTFQTIPAGTDLSTYFAENPVPDNAKTEMLCYDLEAGGSYTLSESVDFGNKQVTLRTTSATNHAKLTYTGKVSLKTGNIFTLKNLDIDASQSENPMLSLSETPDESLKGATGKGDYYNIKGSVTLNGCNITGVNNNLVYDGNAKYCLEAMVINNCVIKLTSSAATNITGNAIVYFKSGYANTLNVTNSTIWNAGDADAKYFVQYNNSGRADRAGYNNQYVIFQNSTFYNIAKAGQWANYSGFNGQKYSVFTVTNNIFVDCGNKQIARRIMGGRGASSYPAGQVTFANNTYMFNGEFESVSGVVDPYDMSGTAIEEDPGFKDATNGDFTISGATQLSRKTGDPRWIAE